MKILLFSAANRNRIWSLAIYIILFRVYSTHPKIMMAAWMPDMKIVKRSVVVRIEMIMMKIFILL